MTKRTKLTATKQAAIRVLATRELAVAHGGAASLVGIDFAYRAELTAWGASEIDLKELLEA